jgi:hypothetical protein
MEARAAAVVRLRIRVVPTASAAAPVRQPERGRALVLAWSSVLGAAAAAWFALWRIGRAVRARREHALE